MLLLVLALIGQVKHGEIYWTTQKGPLTRVVDNTGINVVPLLPKWVKGEKFPAEGLTTFKQINPVPTKWGSYFVFEKEFRGTPKWTCMVGSELINAPRIFGYYEDDYVYVWGVNFQDLYGSPPKVYFVDEFVSELPIYRPAGDRQQKQGYYENPYLIRVKPPKSGYIVVYTGEMGLLGCGSIYYEKPPEKKVVLLTEDVNGPLDVVSGTICKGNVNVSGPVTIYSGGELHGVTIKKNQPYSVRMMDNTTLKDCTIENFQDESACVEVFGRIRLEQNKFKGIRACAVKARRVEKCVVLRNTFEGISRYTTTGAYFPVGSNSALVENKVINSYRGIVAQANNGPVRHNLILRNDFDAGGPDIMGGEQIIFETKAEDVTQPLPQVGQTVMVNGGTDKGSFYIQTINGPDRPVKVDPTSTYSVGNIATENVFILNRITNSRVGLSFWKYSAGNVVSGLQCTNVPWGFVQNGGAEHGYAFSNELRDSFFQTSTVNLTNAKADGHTINFKMNRVECLLSPFRAYNLDATEAGEGVFMFKCFFGLVDGFPLGLDRELTTPKLPFPAITSQGINHIVVRDCRLNGLKTNLEELCK